MRAAFGPGCAAGTSEIDYRTLRVEGADEAVLLFAAATSFVDYTDVSADPAERVRSTLSRVRGRTWDTIRAEHVQEHRSWFDRVELSLGGPSKATALPTNERIERLADTTDPGHGGALLPVRSLPAHRQLAPGHRARQPPGDLERQPEPVVGQQVHHQHQPAHELLARRDGQPAGDGGAAGALCARGGRGGRGHGTGALERPRLGTAPEHRPVALDDPDGRSFMGCMARGRGVDHDEPVRALPLQPATRRTWNGSTRCSEARFSSSSISSSSTRSTDGWSPRHPTRPRTSPPGRATVASSTR